LVGLSCSAAPQPKTVGPPAQERWTMGATEWQGPGASQAFSTALSRYAAAVDDFASASPDEVAPRLRRAFDALGDAIAAIPRRGGLDAPDMAAGIHALAAHFERERRLSVDQARVAEDLLQRTEAILAIAAEHEYADATAVSVQVRALHLQNATVDPRSPLSLELPEVLGSLRSIGRVLRAMAAFRGP
jgi:hypothetical protein